MVYGRFADPGFALVYRLLVPLCLVVGAVGWKAGIPLLPLFGGRGGVVVESFLLAGVRAELGCVALLGVVLLGGFGHQASNWITPVAGVSAPVVGKPCRFIVGGVYLSEERHGLPVAVVHQPRFP